MENKFILLLVVGMLFITELSINAESQVDYDIVSISVKTSSYDTANPPVFARVKYNKLCPLIITSDDMGRGEFARNWSFFNGYPVFGDASYGQLDKVMTILDAPYNKSTLAMQEMDLMSETFEPLTYTDGTGGIRRFAATSSIMPYKIGTKYTYINQEHAKAMVRTGWSFAQHDVADGITASDRENYIAEQFGVQSKIMEGITGYGEKILVEPNGDHSYIGASMKSKEICWNIFQNASVDYPALSTSIDDWTKGTDYTSFDAKPKGAVERFFFQGKEKSWFEKIESADGSNMIIGGTHGIGNEVLKFLRDKVQSSDKFWVAGADEVWEYYHLYNNSIIENLKYADNVLTFDVRIPKYAKHQFRELTINIPGVKDGTECSFSDNVVTGGAAQDASCFVLNIGLEDKIYQHIDELIALYRSNQHNLYIKRDAQYLINRLVEGNRKDVFQQRLDAAPNHIYKIATSLGGVLQEGATDVDTTIWYSYPKYLLKETDLYMAEANKSGAGYVNSLTLSLSEEKVVVEYRKVAEKVVFLSEGENIEGTAVNTTTYDKINENSGQAFALKNASNGIGGIVSKNIPVVTLSPGKYKLVAAVGDSWNDATHFATFTFKVDDDIVFTFQTDKKGVKEYIKDDINVEKEQRLTVEATGTGVSRWLDYLYIQYSDANDTGIEDVINSDVKVDMYMLDGRRVIDPTNGIYIIRSADKNFDGKKIFVK